MRKIADNSSAAANKGKNNNGIRRRWSWYLHPLPRSIRYLDEFVRPTYSTVTAAAAAHVKVMSLKLYCIALQTSWRASGGQVSWIGCTSMPQFWEVSKVNNQVVCVALMNFWNSLCTRKLPSVHIYKCLCVCVCVFVCANFSILQSFSIALSKKSTEAIMQNITTLRRIFEVMAVEDCGNYDFSRLRIVVLLL